MRSFFYAIGQRFAPRSALSKWQSYLDREKPGTMQTQIGRIGGWAGWGETEGERGVEEDATSTFEYPPIRLPPHLAAIALFSSLFISPSTPYPLSPLLPCAPHLVKWARL